MKVKPLIREEITGRIKMIRIRLNMGQAEFSELFQMSYTNYSRMERGEIWPRPKVQASLICGYGISPDWLYYGKGKIVSRERHDPGEYKTGRAGKRVKVIRGTMGWTQYEFGNRIGKKRGNVSQLEAGNIEPCPHTFAFLLCELNVNPVWLFTGKGEMFLGPIVKYKREELRKFIAEGNG